MSYSTIGHPSAFSGVTNAKRYYTETPRSQIEHALTQSDAYTRTREVKPPDYNFTYVNRLREIVEIDLMDVSQLKTRNRGIAYYLVAIDVFSKKAFVAGMKTKTAAAAREAFEMILGDMSMSDQIDRIHCDDGSEWKGVFEDLLRERGIEKKVAGRHASTIERWQRTCKSLLSRYMTEYETVYHVDVMDRVLDTYNNRFHRSIQTSPNLADMPENSNAVRYAVAVSRRDKESRQFKKKPKFAEGDLVRVQLSSNTWQRSFQPTFGVDVFRVTRVHTSLPEPMYSVKKLGSDQREEYRRRYSTELQRVNLRTFKIAKVHWRRKRTNPATGKEEVFVDFQGLPKEEGGAYVERDSLGERRRAAARLWT